MTVTASPCLGINGGSITLSCQFLVSGQCPSQEEPNFPGLRIFTRLFQYQTLTFQFSFGMPLMSCDKRFLCVEGLPLWHNSSSETNAYGFSNSNEENFNVSIWYNSTYISWWSSL
ncbi:hypothetical protein ACE6H2_018142 [Prunus campanulata]